MAISRKKSDGSVIDNGNYGAGCHFLFFKQKGFDIKVKNQAVENISGLYLSYQHIPRLYRLPSPWIPSMVTVKKSIDCS